MTINNLGITEFRRILWEDYGKLITDFYNSLPDLKKETIINTNLLEVALKNEWEKIG